MASGYTVAVILILILVVVILIVYVIAMYEFYKKQTFIFSPYTPKPRPDNAIYMGTITPLTPEAILERNAKIAAALAAQPT